MKVFEPEALAGAPDGFLHEGVEATATCPGC